MSNRELLDHLFSTNRIELNRGSLFDTPPPALPEKIDPDRVEGMLLGLAIGDALGMTTEGPGWSVERRFRLYPGGVSDYFNGLGQPDPVGGRGKPSDDTQLSFWTLEQILQDGALVPENVARLFVAREMEIVGRGGPRQVARVMSIGGGPVPWWRVVRADGRPAPCHDGEAAALLRGEGTPFRPDGARLDMRRAFWADALARS